MQRSIVLALAFLAFNLCDAALLGSQSCTRGPAYWCQGLKEAKECSATTHCIHKFWAKQVVPEDDDEVCTICLNMVKEARDTLRSKETIDELKQVFYGSCDFIPLKIVSDECKKLSDEFIAELVEMLSSEMNPQLVCSTAGLCNSARIDRLLAQYYAKHPRTECDVCKAESNKLVHMINQLPAERIKDKFFEVCGYLGSYSDACRATVAENFELIHDVLSSLGKGELCNFVGICSESNKDLLSTYVSTNKEDIQCEFCEKVIKHWVTTWTANTTQAEFKEVLEAFCHKIQDSQRQQRCLHIVDDYYIPWFDFLLHEVNPHEICAFVGLCGSGSFMEVDPKSSITLLLNPVRSGLSDHEIMTQAQSESDNSPALIGGYVISQTELYAEKPGCVICEYAMETLQKELGTNKTADQVEKAVEHLCDYLPSSVRGQCENLVEAYGPAIIQLLVHDIEPKEICSRLGLCTDDLLEQQFSHPTPELQLLKRGQDSCALCEFAMNYVYSILNDTTDQQEIVNVLDSICFKMPHSIRNECEKFVATYTKPIIEMIVQSFTPDQVCQGLKMCNAKLFDEMDICGLGGYCGSDEDDSSIEDTQEVSSEVEGDERPFCLLCELAIGEVDQVITDKKNEEEIRKALDEICYKLSAPISKECTNMVNTYMEKLIELFVKEYTPEQICKEIRMCKNTESLPEFHNEIPPLSNEIEMQDDSAEEKQGPFCVICEFAMTILEKQLINNRTVDIVERAVQMVCSYMPHTVAEKCERFVDEYGDQIVHIIVDTELGPEMVCSSLALCAAKVEATTEAVIGGRRCVWGPSYWCQSRFHARMCGTTEHCEANVWKNEN